MKEELYMQRRGEMPVVYLDQNWMSETTKSQIVGRPNRDKAFYSQLSSALHSGVSEGKFVCPTSEFHHTEASFNPDLRAAIPLVASALSRGLSFNSYIHVNHKQLVAAASEFAGQDVPSTPWWHIPFNWDPDAPAQWSPDLSNREYPIMIDFAEETKQIRDGLQTTLYRKFKNEVRKEGRSYEEAVELGRIQIFRELHFGVADATEQGFFKAHRFGQLYSSEGPEALGRYNELEMICEQTSGIEMFLKSCHFTNTPFLSIFAKLRAADLVRFFNHEPQPSQMADFHIAALVIPYADMFATENYMAELIRQTGLDKDYDCNVYTMRQRKDFLDVLQAM